MNVKTRTLFPTVMIALILITSFSEVAHIGSLFKVGGGLILETETSEDIFGKSNITISAYQNMTLIPTNNVVDLGLSAEINPANLTFDVVKEFEPEQRFNSEANYAFDRSGNSINASLKETDDGLHLLFDAESSTKPSISVYNLSFVNSVNISGSDFLSLAISTENGYNSTEAYIGVALLLRDQEGDRHYMFIHISNLFSTDSYQLSKWFLGWSYGEQYPQYGMMYRSLFGPWFVQLPLLEAFTSLDLSSAWLDGLLIGAELYSIPLPFNMTHVDVRFHYALVHPQRFSLNEQLVNSTLVAMPSTRFLNISGIPCKRLNAAATGPLWPTYQKEEQRENQTVVVREVFYNFSEPFIYNFSGPSVGEVQFGGNVSIITQSKNVRKCTVTLNNDTIVDLTDGVLRSENELLYHIPFGTHTLKVFLVLYKFNAWIFNLAYTTLYGLTKKGIVEEYFVPDKNEAVAIVDLHEVQLQEASIAVRAGNFSSTEISVNGIKNPLDSLLVLNKDVFLGTSVKAKENDSLYTVRYTFSSDPLYTCSTVQPFSIFLDNALFIIYTPFNVEAQQGIQIPFTISIYNYRTYILKIEFDSSMFEVDNDEIMVLKYGGHEYFMIRPVGLGLTWAELHFVDPTDENVNVSVPFLINITHSLPYQITSYILLIVTVLSLVYIISGKNIVEWLSYQLKRKKR